MLSKYGILYSKYLEKYKPITYQELIMNGTINDFLKLKDKEFNDLRNSIIMELKNKYKMEYHNTHIFVTGIFRELSNFYIFKKASHALKKKFHDNGSPPTPATT